MRLLSGLYLVLALAGAVVPWTFNVRAMQELGRSFTPAEFIAVGFQGSPLLGSVAADFWIGASAALVFIVVEARRLKMRWWLYVIVTFAVAFACALPLFLFMRERKLAAMRS